MPDLQTHVNVVAPIVVGTSVSGIVGFVFDISPEVLLAAFVGCFIGVVALRRRPHIEDIDTKNSVALRFLLTLVLVFISTIATAYLVPILFVLFPAFAQKSIAALSGFIVVLFSSIILDSMEAALKRMLGKVGI